MDVEMAMVKMAKVEMDVEMEMVEMDVELAMVEMDVEMAMDEAHDDDGRKYNNMRIVYKSY